MNNEIKLDDIINDLYTLYCNDCIHISKLNYLLKNIESHIERFKNETKDEYYFDILDIYNELNNLPKNNKTGRIKKISFNHIYQYYKNKYDNKKK
jgi:hypothetical protein